MHEQPTFDVFVADKLLEKRSAETLQRLQGDLNTLSQMNSLCSSLSLARQVGLCMPCLLLLLLLHCTGAVPHSRGETQMIAILCNYRRACSGTIEVCV